MEHNNETKAKGPSRKPWAVAAVASLLLNCWAGWHAVNVLEGTAAFGNGVASWQAWVLGMVSLLTLVCWIYCLRQISKLRRKDDRRDS
jgi:hypothetical protein